MIQIRNVPGSVHARLKEKANLAGMNLSDYLKEEVTRIADTLSWGEVADRMAEHRVAITPGEVADSIRLDRGTQ